MERAICPALQLQVVAGKGEVPQSREIGHWTQKEEPKDWEGVGCVPGETQTLVGTMKGHLSLKAPRKSLGGAGTTFYLLSPRSRVLSFMRAVRAYPRVAGRDMWDCSTLSNSASTSSSSTFGEEGNR